MASIVQERFPAFGAIVTTSVSAAQATSTIEAVLSTMGPVMMRAPHELRFRISWRVRGRWLTPDITARVVSSVAGSNVYVRFPDERIWRVFHMTLLLTVLGGAVFSFLSGESLIAPWIALGALCVSIGGTWYIGHRAVRILRDVLPD